MKRYHNINIFKVVMAIFVVAIHTHPFELISDSRIANIFSAIFEIAVPFFLLSTGFLLGKKIDVDDFSSNSNKELIVYNIKKYLKLYIKFTIIYLPITILYYFINDKGLLYDSLDFIRGLIIVGEHYNSWMLWYLLSMVYSFIFIEICIIRKHNFKFTFFFSIVLFVFGVIIDIILGLNVSNNLLKKIIMFINIIFSSGRIFRNLIYIVFGIIISKKEDNVFKNKLILLFVFLIGIFLRTIVFNEVGYIFDFITSTSVFLICLNIKTDNRKFADLCNYLSIVIYFSHMYVRTIYSLIFGGSILNTMYGINCFIFTFCFSTILGLILYYAKKSKNKICN